MVHLIPLVFWGCSKEVLDRGLFLKSARKIRKAHVQVHNKLASKLAFLLGGAQLPGCMWPQPLLFKTFLN